MPIKTANHFSILISHPVRHCYFQLETASQSCLFHGNVALSWWMKNSNQNLTKMAELDELRTSFNEIKTEFKLNNDKIDELLRKIDGKDNKITSLERRIEVLESKNLICENVIALLERKVDDNESYQRRLSLRISGIPNPAKSEEDCIEKVKMVIDKLDVSIPDFAIDRAHRLGPFVKDGKSVNRPVIVRFVSWRARTAIYRKREKKGKVKFYIDLTKRRFLLNKSAEEKVTNNDKVDFAFADVNNNLCLF